MQADEDAAKKRVAQAQSIVDDGKVTIRNLEADTAARQRDLNALPDSIRQDESRLREPVGSGGPARQARDDAAQRVRDAQAALARAEHYVVCTARPGNRTARPDGSPVPPRCLGPFFG